MTALVRSTLRFLGYHVCEEFTPWVVHSKVFRIPNWPGAEYHFKDIPKRWQERSCLECGWTQWSRLESC